VKSLDLGHLILLLVISLDPYLYGLYREVEYGVTDGSEGR
jgi:hypothetical protein